MVYIFFILQLDCIRLRTQQSMFNIFYIKSRKDKLCDGRAHFLTRIVKYAKTENVTRS